MQRFNSMDYIICVVQRQYNYVGKKYQQNEKKKNCHRQRKCPQPLRATPPPHPSRTKFFKPTYSILR
jgi:hypothetical protein